MLLLFAATVLSADLSIDNYALGGARPGGPISYFIQIRNHGPEAAANVTLDNAIPPNTSFIGEEHPAGTTCTAAATFTCTTPTLANGANLLFILVVQVDRSAAQGTVISSTAVVNPGGLSATADATVSGPPYISTDLDISSSGPPNALAGAMIPYSISVQNKGPVDAKTVSIVDLIPANSTFISATQTSGPPFNCSGTPGSRRGFRCDAETLATGETATFTIQIRSDPGSPTSTISNTASITSDTPDLIGPNQATTTTAITAVPGSTADLSLSINSPRDVDPGGVVTSYFDVINTGPADATNVTLIAPTATETTFLSASAPAGATCVAPDVSGTGTYRCTIPSLANGQSVRFTMTLQVNLKPATAIVSGSASVSSDTPDPDMTYNSAASQVLIDIADLALSASAGSTVVAGGQITYAIEVRNNGPAASNAVLVEDTLPDGARLVSAVPSQGVCAGTSCLLGTIPLGGVATVTLKVTAPPTPGPFTNAVKVTSGTIDLTIKNNAASITVMAVGPIRCSRMSRGRCVN